MSATADEGRPSASGARVLRGVYAAAGALAGAATLLRSLRADPATALLLRERRGDWAGHAGDPRPWVWIHSASFGEAEIALALARRLAAARPDLRYVLSSVTASGKARTGASEGVESRFFPIDYARYVKKVLSPRPPRLFVAVETEIWPETLRLLREAGTPVSVVNARISDRTLPRYRRLLPLLGELLGAVAKICARDREAATRWRALGVPGEAIVVTGNIKFDLALPAEGGGTLPLFEREAGRPLLLAASTHAGREGEGQGEELLAIEAWARLRASRPGLRLLLAPRHPERAAGIAEAARARGIDSVLWSRGGEAVTAFRELLVLDTLGLLRAAYESAEAAFVGGSVVAGPGGHNLLEAAVAGCPVAAGEHLGNVEDQASLLREAGALRIVHDVEQLASFWSEVLDSPAHFREAAARAAVAVEGGRGALERSVAELLPLLEGSAA